MIRTFWAPKRVCNDICELFSQWQWKEEPSMMRNDLLPSKVTPSTSSQCSSRWFHFSRQIQCCWGICGILCHNGNVGLDKTSASSLQNWLENMREQNISSAVHSIKLFLFNLCGQLYTRVEGTVLCVIVYSAEYHAKEVTDVHTKISICIVPWADDKPPTTIEIWLP